MSPDGELVALIETDVSGKGRIAVVDCSGAVRRRSLRGIRPDSSQVLASSPGRPFWLYPLNGGSPFPAKGFLADDRPIRWSDDGASIWTVNQASGVPQIIRIDPATGTRRQWRDIKYADPAGLNPDGLRVLMSADGKSYVHGYNRTLDQSRNPNFAVLQNAARAGRFVGVVGVEDFGKEPRNDTNNVQPRVGFALDLRGTGRDVVRGGWGVYTDASFTNNNVLFKASDANGPFPALEFVATNPNGIRKPDGTFFRVGDPIASIASWNEASPGGLGGEVVSPGLQLPYTLQASFGWSHQLGVSSASALTSFMPTERLSRPARPSRGARRSRAATLRRG